MSEEKQSAWAKFMEKNWLIGSVRVYLWPFVMVAVVSCTALLVNIVLYG